MLKEVHQACEKLNNRLGISVPLPTPGKNALRTASVCHFAVGAALITVGAASSSKLWAVLGSIGIISGVVLRQERVRSNDEAAL